MVSQNDLTAKYVAPAFAHATLPLNASVVDLGRVRIGSGSRARPSTVTSGQTVDSGKVRIGNGSRIRLQNR